MVRAHACLFSNANLVLCDRSSPRQMLIKLVPDQQNRSMAETLLSKLRLYIPSHCSACPNRHQGPSVSVDSSPLHQCWSPCVEYVPLFDVMPRFSYPPHCLLLPLLCIHYNAHRLLQVQCVLNCCSSISPNVLILITMRPILPMCTSVRLHIPQPFPGLHKIARVYDINSNSVPSSPQSPSRCLSLWGLIFGQ